MSVKDPVIEMKNLLNITAKISLLGMPLLLGVLFRSENEIPQWFLSLGLPVVLILLVLLQRHSLFGKFPLCWLPVLLNLLVVQPLNPSLSLRLHPVAMNLSFLLMFAWSRFSPPTVIESIARIKEPELPEEGVAYCTRVTEVWCLFLVVNGTLSCWTALYSSWESWSWYNGVISYVLMGLLGIGEYITRYQVKKRVKATLVVLVTLLPLSLHAENVPAQELIPNLGSSKGVEVHFEEERIVPSLKKPLRSRGTMVFFKEKGVLWSVETPVALEYVITPRYLVRRIPGEEEEKISPSSHPSLLAFSKLFPALLSGDQHTLQELFSLSQKKSDRGWEITAASKDPGLSPFLEKLTLQGETWPKEVVLYETSGDTVTIRFQTFTPLENLPEKYVQAFILPSS